MRPLHWDEVNPLTGLPYTFDDPNLRWGEPAYALEPGDPGFVPYSPSTPPPEPTRKTPRMKRTDWYPVRNAAQIVWLQNFVAKLAGHAPSLGISVADCAARIADARWLIYVLGTWLPAIRTWQQACTEATRTVQTGGGGLVPLPVFVPPPLPGASGTLPAVVAVEEGGLDRIFDTVNDLRSLASQAVQEDLGIIGSEQTGPDYAAFGPKLTTEMTATGVQLGWGWQGFGRFLDQCEIEVDRADAKGWVLLTYDTTPGYQDTAPFPAALTKWKYRAIYRVEDARIGQWSPEVTVTVGG